MYGYWTHCVYSCDAQAYDNHIKHNRPLPMVKMDENFNEINSSSSLFNSRHNHSDSELAHAKFELANEDDTPRKTNNNELNERKSDEAQRKLAATKKAELASAGLLQSVSGAHSLDVTELWRVVPRPSYAEDVSSLFLPDHLRI